MTDYPEEFNNWLKKIEQDIKSTPEFKSQEYLKNLEKQIPPPKPRPGKPVPKLPNDKETKQLIQVYHILYGNNSEVNLPFFVELGKEQLYSWNCFFMKPNPEELAPYITSTYYNMKNAKFERPVYNANDLNRAVKNAADPVFEYPEKESESDHVILNEIINRLFFDPHMPLNIGPSSFITVWMEDILKHPDVYSKPNKNTVMFFPNVTRIVASSYPPADILRQLSKTTISVQELFQNLYELTNLEEAKSLLEISKELGIKSMSMKEFLKMVSNKEERQGGMAELFRGLIHPLYIDDVCAELLYQIYKKDSDIYPHFYRRGSNLQKNLYGDVVYGKGTRPVTSVIFEDALLSKKVK